MTNGARVDNQQKFSHISSIYSEADPTMPTKLEVSGAFVE